MKSIRKARPLFAIAPSMGLHWGRNTEVEKDAEQECGELRVARLRIAFIELITKAGFEIAHVLARDTLNFAA